jgi:hypothetical protein
MDPAQYANGGTVGHACLDEENVHFTVLTPNVPTGERPVARRPLPRAERAARRAHPHVVGRRPRERHERAVAHAARLRHLHLRPTTAQNQLVYNDRTTWDLNALPSSPRTEPPVIGSAPAQQDSTIPVRIGSVNIAQTSLNETVSGAQFNNTPLGQALQQGAVAVRVIEGFSSEAGKGVSMFGLTMFEGAAVLGEAPVYQDGSWLANVPPVHPDPPPADRQVRPRDPQPAALDPGHARRDRRCVGCHESRTGQGVPAFGAEPDGRRAARPQPTSPRPSPIAPSTRGTRRSSRSSMPTASAATTRRRPRTTP